MATVQWVTARRRCYCTAHTYNGDPFLSKWEPTDKIWSPWASESPNEDQCGNSTIGSKNVNLRFPVRLSMLCASHSLGVRGEEGPPPSNQKMGLKAQEGGLQVRGSPCNLSINATLLNSDRIFIDINTMPTGQFCDYA